MATTAAILETKTSPYDDIFTATHRGRFYAHKKLFYLLHAFYREAARADFFTMAVRAFVFDDAGVAAYWVTVNRVVDGEIPHICIMHCTNYVLKCLDVFGRVAIHLDVGNVTSIFECMVRCFNADFIDGFYRILYRDMTGVRHVVAVRNALNDTVFLAVAALELACR